MKKLLLIIPILILFSGCGSIYDYYSEAHIAEIENHCAEKGLDTRKLKDSNGVYILVECSSVSSTTNQ